LTIDPSVRAEFLQDRPWARSWWRPAPGDGLTFTWLVLIHATAAVGLLLVPIPSWPVLGAALALTWLGGIGTTVCYHRSLAHRAVRLHPAVRTPLILAAMLNGSGSPATWTANHRLHHANSDTVEDISSPLIGGFWWAHLRWLWQAGQVPVARYCPDLETPGYRRWSTWQPAIVLVSLAGGAVFGLEAFFWLGAIRLVYSLHGQCFVNSVCHMGGDARPGEDSSRNVGWLALWHFGQGENWHRNHHALPWSARLGMKAQQLDVGWWVILGLEKLGLARDVRRPWPSRTAPEPAAA
jgi:stearoyl-CoA desaturase (delta-9 desaturase)